MHLAAVYKEMDTGTTTAAARHEVDERNSTPDECAREMSSNRQAAQLSAIDKTSTVAPSSTLPIPLEPETDTAPVELVLDEDEYEEFQRDPYAYLGVDAAEVELDVKVCKGEQFSSRAEAPPIAAAKVDVCAPGNGKDDLGDRNSSSPSESRIQQTAITTPSSSRYHYVSRIGVHLPTELKEIVCKLLLDKCRPDGSLKTKTLKAVANRLQMAAETVGRIWTCMLWSVVETGVINPCYPRKRVRLDRTKAYAAMADALGKRNSAATSISTRSIDGAVSSLPSAMTAARPRNNQFSAFTATTTVPHQSLQSAFGFEYMPCPSTPHGSGPMLRSGYPIEHAATALGFYECHRPRWEAGTSTEERQQQQHAMVQMAAAAHTGAYIHVPHMNHHATVAAAGLYAWSSSPPPPFWSGNGNYARFNQFAANTQGFPECHNPRGHRNRAAFTEGGIQPTTLTVSPSSSAPSRSLVRKGRGLPTEKREIVCNLLLDMCRPNGSLEINACHTVANQVQSTEGVVRCIWYSMLRSVVETGAIDPCLSAKRCRAPIDKPTAYACMADALRRRNNAAIAASSTRPVGGGTVASPPSTIVTAARSMNDERVASVAAAAAAAAATTTVSHQPLQSALETESLSSLSTQTRGSTLASRSSPSWNPTSPAILPRRDLDAAWYPQNLYM